MNKLTRHQISKILAKRTLETAGTREIAQDIAAYLLDSGRTSQLESIMRDVLQYRAEKGIVEVITYSAHPLTSELRSAVEKQIRASYPDASRIIISGQLDKSLIGSIRMELANQQLDATVRTKLNHFKQLTAAGKD